jgi:SM-20-related protein
MIANFLTKPENFNLLKQVIDVEDKFRTSSVTTAANDYRKSLVLKGSNNLIDSTAKLIRERLSQKLPEVFIHLKIPTFKVANIEMQITAHNHNDYYKTHVDNDSFETSRRLLTYVYYFNKNPQNYSGGQLRLYDSEKTSFLCYKAANTYQDIEPTNNCVIFFLSSIHHEVLPVKCPSQSFQDGRFTVNGWIYR